MWLVNEKGAAAAAGRLPGAPEGFAERAQRLLGHVRVTPAELQRSVDPGAALVEDVRVACAAT